MLKKKPIIIKALLPITLLFIILLASGITVRAEEEIYDWEGLRVRYENFLGEQSEENKKALYNILPEKRFDRNIYHMKPKLLNYIFDNLDSLDHLAQKGDLLALKILFRLKFFSDGAVSTWINIMIGSSITANPENFLIALEENLDKQNGISSILANLGPDYVDKFKKQAEALWQRYFAIKNVEINDVNNISPSTKSISLYFLSSAIASAHKLDLYMSGNEDMIEKYR